MKMMAAVLSAEILKLRRTLALWMVLLAPLILVVLSAMIIGIGAVSPAKTGWEIIGRQAVNMWTFFMLPLFIALETALFSGIDHQAQAWKRIYAMPVPRWMVYASKQVLVLLLIGVSSVVLGILLPLSFYAVQSLPGIEAPELPPPVLSIATWIVRAYLASWLIVAIHHWVSMRWASFTVALGVAIAATMGIIQIGSSKWWIVYPWTFPLTAASGSDPANQSLAILISVVGCLVVSVVAGWTVVRRDVL